MQPLDAIPRCVTCRVLPGDVHDLECASAHGQNYFDPRLGEHEITEGCHADHCEWHHVDEPGPAYRVCPECWHSYGSAKALRVAYRREAYRILWGDLRRPLAATVTPALRAEAKAAGFPVPRFPRLALLATLARVPFTRAKSIFFCQLCKHDF